MTQDEANRWYKALVKDSEARGFLGASNYYSYIAKRPEER